DLYRERVETATLAPVNLDRCTKEAVALTAPRWRSQALAIGVTIRMETDVADRLPPIVGDETELREMLTNPIFNAVDAMPAGRTRARGGGVAASPAHPRRGGRARRAQGALAAAPRRGTHRGDRG